MTLSGSSICLFLIAGFVYESTSPESALIYGSLMIYCIIEIVLIEVHRRYLDRLRFARNDLLKDRLIMQEYNIILQKRQLERQLEMERCIKLLEQKQRTSLLIKETN